SGNTQSGIWIDSQLAVQHPSLLKLPTLQVNHIFSKPTNSSLGDIFIVDESLSWQNSNGILFTGIQRGSQSALALQVIFPDIEFSGLLRSSSCFFKQFIHALVQIIILTILVWISVFVIQIRKKRAFAEELSIQGISYWEMFWPDVQDGIQSALISLWFMIPVCFLIQQYPLAIPLKEWALLALLIGWVSLLLAVLGSFLVVPLLLSAKLRKAVQQFFWHFHNYFTNHSWLQKQLSALVLQLTILVVISVSVSVLVFKELQGFINIASLPSYTSVSISSPAESDSQSFTNLIEYIRPSSLVRKEDTIFLNLSSEREKDGLILMESWYQLKGGSLSITYGNRQGFLNLNGFQPLITAFVLLFAGGGIVYLWGCYIQHRSADCQQLLDELELSSIYSKPSAILFFVFFGIGLVLNMLISFHSLNTHIYFSGFVWLILFMTGSFPFLKSMFSNQK
ncbi:MAG: hypothetical protein HUJ54_13065, partial [Erysipelotrichaceae bacterium]|nr:hypothetical protein [Erysipelotrichaceae bacterium]